MPTLYIIRGLPGSGKSTLARRIVHESRHREADMFFMVNGAYRYDAAKIKDAHAWCLREVELLMAGEPEGCAVSNTFTRRWEYERYEAAACAAGYDVQVIECHGKWQNTHGVSDAVLGSMAERWEHHK